MISGASIDRCVRILLTTYYHMHHYTVQLLGRWSRVHIGNIIRPLNFSEAAEGSSIHWKKCSTKNMLIALKTDKYLLEISSMHLTQVQYDLDIDYATLVLRQAYFFRDKRTFLRLYESKLKRLGLFFRSVHAY